MHFPIFGTKWRLPDMEGVHTVSTGHLYSFQPIPRKWTVDAEFVEDFSEVGLCRVIAINERGGHLCTSLSPLDHPYNRPNTVSYIYSRDGIVRLSEEHHYLNHVLENIPNIAFASLRGLGFGEFLELITLPFVTWADEQTYHFAETMDDHEMTLLKLSSPRTVYQHVPIHLP